MLNLRILISPSHPRIRIHNCNRVAQVITNSFTSAAPLQRKKSLPPRRPLDENELEERFIRGSGPGGQKIVRFPRSPYPRLLPSFMPPHHLFPSSFFVLLLSSFPFLSFPYQLIHLPNLRKPTLTCEPPLPPPQGARS